ncbi:MAG: nitroreductase family protein [Clostridia bacterium]|nr:nitroreductase family protein [Clostridia bacterium]
MVFDEIIKKRNSCRCYLPEPIDDETIKQIVEAGRLAPSAKNTQPWKFVCIKTNYDNPINSKKIASIMSDYYIKNKDNPEKIKGASSLYATSKIIEDCPAIILVFTDSDYINRDKMESISDILSIGSCVEHMVLKATDLGLGTLWIADTYFIHKELAEYIQSELIKKQINFVLEKNRLVCAMALGKRGEPFYERPRKSIDDILLILNN